MGNPVDEVVRVQRKHRIEDYIHQEKREHLPTVSRRTWKPEGFSSENWNEAQQEEDEWQTPDKWQWILQMVFSGRCLEINPVEYGYISSSCTQHQGAELAYLRSREKKPTCREVCFSNPTRAAG